jgi:hypothetical protein
MANCKLGANVVPSTSRPSHQRGTQSCSDEPPLTGPAWWYALPIEVKKEVKPENGLETASMMGQMAKIAEKVIDASAMAAALEVLGTARWLDVLESFTTNVLSLASRFLSHVDLDHRPEPTSCAGYGPCLLWTGAVNKGYAVMSVRGKMKRATHVAWFLANLVWPKYLCHACDNPRCVAIDHLIAANAAFNAYDRVVKKKGGVLMNG